MPKILMLVLWFDEVPGRWTYFKEMASRIADAGLRTIVVSPRASGHRRKEKIGNVVVYRFSSVYIPRIPLLVIDPIDFFRTLIKIDQEEKFIDLIYDTTSGAMPLSLLAKLFFKLKGTSKPLVVHVHGELKDLKSRGLVSLLFESYLHLGARLCFVVADRILLAGEKIAPRVLGLGANPNKLELVQLGLKYEGKLLQCPILNEEEKVSIKTSVGLRKEDFVIGYVGRLSLGKGLDVLLRAVAMIRNSTPELKVVLVGDGGQRADLCALASSLGIADITLFLGHREDVPNLLQSMDVFVNASESEAGISGAQLEAMRFALPAVITPFTDMVKHMKDAIIVPFNDPRAVAEAILLLHSNDNLRKTIGMNASTRAQELLRKYTWRDYTNKVLEVFRNVTQSA